MNETQVSDANLAAQGQFVGMYNNQGTAVIDYGQVNYWPYVRLHVWPTPRCAWCQETHYGSCERLKSVTYRKDGTVERVEFFERDD
jgi:hypothetical protein